MPLLVNRAAFSPAPRVMPPALTWAVCASLPVFLLVKAALGKAAKILDQAYLIIGFLPIRTGCTGYGDIGTFTEGSQGPADISPLLILLTMS